MATPAGPSPRRQQPQSQQGQIDIDRFRDQLLRMRNDYQMLINQQPLPRTELENMRTALQQMQRDLAGHVQRFPNQQANEATIARRDLEGLMADLDHILYGQAMPQQPPGQQNPPGQQPQGQQPPQQGPQQHQPGQPRPQGRSPRRQQAPRLPVPRRAPAPQRTMTYDVSIGPLPFQRYQLTLPPGETIQSLYNAAVQRGQVVEREHQAKALRLDGNPTTPQLMTGQIPPAEASALGQNPTEREMLTLLLRHECFSLNPSRSPAGGDYTSGGAGHIAGFDVAQPIPNPVLGPNPTRSQRMDTFHDLYLDQERAGATIRVALAPPAQGPSTQPAQPGLRRRRGG